MSHTQILFVVVLTCLQLGCSRTDGSPPPKPVQPQIIRPIPGTLAADSSQSMVDSHRLDLQAYVGLPQSYAEQSAAYVGQILKLLNAKSFHRTVYENQHQTGQAVFPLDTFAVAQGEVPVEVVLLPRPDVVRAWIARVPSIEAGWRSLAPESFDSLQFHGKTILFRRGPLSKNPLATFATPHGTMVNEGVYVYGECFLESGKLVTPHYGEEGTGESDDRSRSLQLGKKNGAVLIAELRTTPAFGSNTRIWLTSLVQDGVQTISTAYALIDGNGGQRQPHDERVSPFVRPLQCPQHQPQIGPHDLLLLPTPIDRNRSVGRPYEDWALDEWFGQQKSGAWVLREAEDSKPLQESFLLLPASEVSTRPPYQIIVFPETPPEQLVRDLAQLYRVTENADAVSPEAMQDLKKRFQQIREFGTGLK